MTLRSACKGINVDSIITPEEKKLAKELGLIREEVESAIEGLLRVAKILKANGVDLRRIILTETQEGKRKAFKLSELKQEGIDIGAIIESNRFRSRFSIWK